MLAATWCGNTYRIAHRYDEAARHLVDAREIARSLRARKAEASIHHNLGLVYHRMARYAEAEECHRFDLDFCAQHSQVRGAAEAMTALGDALRGRREYAEAVHWLQLAIGVFRKLGDGMGEMRAQSNLVLVNRERFRGRGVGANIVDLCEVLVRSRSEGALHAEA